MFLVWRVPLPTSAMFQQLRKQNLLKFILLFALLILTARQVGKLANHSLLPFDDFLAFWSSGHLLLTGQDPYSYGLIDRLQKSVGFGGSYPMVMWYPPWAFVFMLPFGGLHYSTARLLWLVLSIVALVVSASLLWRIYNGSKNSMPVAWLLAFTFCPSLFVLRNGQMSALVLLGLVSFLYFESDSRSHLREWVAGVMLLLVSLKPHVTYLFWIILALWALRQRRWPLLFAGISAGLLATVIPLFFNHDLIGQYFAIRGRFSSPLFNWPTPTIGTLLRIGFGAERLWLQFLPLIVCILVTLPYWVRHRDDWDWGKNMPMVLSLSLMTSVYEWEPDFVLLLPLVIQIAVRASEISHRLKLIMAALYLVINVIGMIQNVLVVNPAWFVWFAPTLLACYLIVIVWPIREDRSNQSHPPMPPISPMMGAKLRNRLEGTGPKEQ